jgi:small-conductance mechanosensitive channel
MLATGGTVNPSTMRGDASAVAYSRFTAGAFGFLSQSLGELLTAIAMVMMVIGYLVWPLVQ